MENAKIVPIPKLNNDYRLILILPFLSKVIENLMSSQIQLYLANNSLLNEKQSGFRKKRSCITAITNIVEDTRQKLDRNCVTILALLDHSKVFESVNHNILYTKLRNMFTFSTNATNVIRSYLTNRYQAVVSGTQISFLRNLPRGVPQGFVLGPLLFFIYVNHLPSILSECKVHLYADDVQIYVGRPVTEIHACVRISNKMLSLVEKWAKENVLGINPKKSKCLVIGKKPISTLSLQKLYINHTPISWG